jgi:hypothetical protein
MKFKRDIKRLLKKEIELEWAIGAILSKVQNVCEFKIHLDDVAGDGWCFGSDISGFPLYMKMEDVLEVVEQTGKFTKDDWSPFN